MRTKVQQRADVCSRSAGQVAGVQKCVDLLSSSLRTKPSSCEVTDAAASEFLSLFLHTSSVKNCRHATK